MILYLDTSSLLKVFLIEDDSAKVASLISQSESIASSRVAYPESRSGLGRADRSGRLPPSAYTDILRQFESFWQGMKHIEVTEAVARLAGDLAEKRALRGFDAIHLASAIAFRDTLSEPVFMAAADERLLEAAVACGLETP